MPGGFFLGGMAEGAMGAQRQALAERTQSDQSDLGFGQLALAERTQGRLEQNDVITRADQQIAATMQTISETVAAGVAAGRDAGQITRAVEPLLQSAQQLAQRVGRDPAALAGQVTAQLARPGAIEGARVTGAAAGAGAVERARAAQQLPGGPESPPDPTAAGTTRPAARVPNVNLFETEAQRAEAEARLRNEYTTQSQPFITIRDSYNRIASIPSGAADDPNVANRANGAGDMALVFQFMKILDPGSTVREGEFRSASQVAGLPSTIAALRNRILGEGQLDDTARRDIRNQANQLYQTQALQHDRLTTNYANMATRGGMRPNQVISDLFPHSETDAQQRERRGGQAPADPDAVFTPGGNRFRIGR